MVVSERLRGRCFFSNGLSRKSFTSFDTVTYFVLLEQSASLSDERSVLKISSCYLFKETEPSKQRWSRGHKAQGQGHPSKDRPSRGQGPRTQAQVFSKKSLQEKFSGLLKKKVFKNYFHSNKILTIQKIVLSSLSSN